MSWELSYGLIGAALTGLLAFAIVLSWWRYLTPSGRALWVGFWLLVGLVIGGITRATR